MRLLILLICFLALGGCVSTPASLSDRILGTWESSVGGFTYSTRYSAEDVTIEGHEAVSYSLEGDRLTIAGDAVMTRIVSFPEPDTMAQLDPVTGTVHLFQRAR